MDRNPDRSEHRLHVLHPIILPKPQRALSVCFLIAVDRICFIVSFVSYSEGGDKVAADAVKRMG
jgi:hypothetical protein